MLRTATTAFAAAAIALTAGAAAAENHVVQMLNRDKEAGESMVFKPAVLKIAPGDSVTFEVTNKGHNAQLIDGLAPEGGTSFRGNINEEITVTFETEGAYGYKCLPHYATGMVGIILVGDSTEGLDAIAEENMPGRAKQRRDEYVEMARGM